ncbi:MAG: DUF222 domain-containing protein [Ilumatobacteraceae bacterium]
MRTAERRLLALEAQRCRIDSEIAALIAQVERERTFRDDGHRTVKGWVLATLGGSDKAARERVLTASTLAALPAVAAAFADGSIGSDHVRAFARTFANRRVREALVVSAELLLEDAVECPFPAFEARLHAWESKADADGAFREAGDIHASRSARVRQVGREAVVEANGSALDGELISQILARSSRSSSTSTFERPVLAACWRSDAQRGYDAFLAIFRAAVGEGPNCSVPVNVNVVIDQRTYEDAARRAAGAPCSRGIRRRIGSTDVRPWTALPCPRTRCSPRRWSGRSAES